MLSTPRRLALALMTLALASPSPSMAMSGYKWKKRPLVVFAPDASHAKLAQQREIVASRRAGFAERHMVVIYVVGDQVSSELGGGPGLSASQLRARIRCGQGQLPRAFGREGWWCEAVCRQSGDERNPLRHH